MIKDTNERVTITLPKKMVELLSLRGNLSKEIKKALCLKIGQVDMPSLYEALKIGISKEDFENGRLWELLGFYD